MLLMSFNVQTYNRLTNQKTEQDKSQRISKE